MTFQAGEKKKKSLGHPASDLATCKYPVLCTMAKQGDSSRNTFSSSSDGEIINACCWTPEICYGDIHTPCHSYVISSRCRHFVITECRKL